MTDEMNDDELEQQLRAQLAALEAKKEEKRKFEADWDAAIALDSARTLEIQRKTAPVTLKDFKIENDRLWFTVEPTRDDIVATLRAFPNVVRDYINNQFHIDPREYASLKPKLFEHKNVFIVNKIEKEIKEWKPTPDFHIELDLGHKRMIATLGPKGNYYLLNRIPGIEWDQRNRRYFIPLTEVWRIPDYLREVDNVKYEPDAKEFIESKIKLRGMLDEIAEREKPELEFLLHDNIKLKEFQGVTLEYSIATDFNVLIGHEMGLGKTPCALAACEYMVRMGIGSKFLIVVPASLKPNWWREIKKFTGLSPYELTGSVPGNYDIAQVIAGKHRYYLINYDILSTVTTVPEEWTVNEAGERIRKEEYDRFLWIELLNTGNFDAVIVDEAHYIKNVGSNRSRCMRELHIPRHLLLTGTPLLNRPSELWPLIHQLDKEAAGPYESFVKHYTVDGKAARNVDELREVLKPLMIRKVKSQVVKELPPIQRIIRDYELSPKARTQYQKVLDGMWADVKKWDGSADNTTVITSILAQLMRMKQVCANDKIPYVADLATELYDQTTNGHRKVLVFSQFVNEPSVVRDVSTRLSPESIWFSGEHSPQERQAMVDRFQTEDNIHFLCAGLKSAREGLNITAAGSVIFADLDWTPANHHQAEARAYGRLSDLHSINSYYVIADDTIEVDIWGLLEAKLNIFNAVIEGTEEIRDSSIVMELLKILKERS